jgi:hypothetical protein
VEFLLFFSVFPTVLSNEVKVLHDARVLKLAAYHEFFVHLSVLGALNLFVVEYLMKFVDTEQLIVKFTVKHAFKHGSLSAYTYLFSRLDFD